MTYTTSRIAFNLLTCQNEINRGYDDYDQNKETSIVHSNTSYQMSPQWIIRSSVGSGKISAHGTVTKIRANVRVDTILIKSLGTCTLCEIDISRFRTAKETIIVHSAYALLECSDKI